MKRSWSCSSHLAWLGIGVLVLLIGINACLGLALYHTQQALTLAKLREAYTFDENTNVLHELQQCELNLTARYAD